MTLARTARRPLLKAALGVAALGGLSGCGALAALGGAATPLDAYDLRPPADGPRAAGAPLARSLVIETPEAAGAIDTDRILIRPHPLQAQYLPGARWTDPAPVLVQTLILRTVENAGALRFAGRRPLGGSGDFALVSEITDFQAELPGNDGAAALVRVRIAARLVRESDAAVVASRVFEATAPAARLETLSVVEAFDAAAAPVSGDLAAWVLRTMGARLA